MDTPHTTGSSNYLFRWIALLTWVLVALAYLVFFLADLRQDFAQLQVPCSGEDCNYLAISQAEADVLEAWDLSLQSYAFLMVGLSVLTVTVFWLLGILILWAQKTSRIAWTVSLFLIVIPISSIADADNLAANNPGLYPLSILLSFLGIFIFLLFLYLFPNGRFYPRWAVIQFIANLLFFSLFQLDYLGMIEVTARIMRFDMLIFILLLLLAVFLQIQRYRRDSSSVERQQTKWILFGFFGFVLGFIVWFLVFGDGLQFAPGAPRLLASLGGWALCQLALCTLPVTMSIAILRYRMWDIDLVIRRTLQYAMLTGILAFVYLGCVVVLQSFVTAVGGQQSSAVIVISTLAIAALFNPLRNRIQDFLERRFYRTRYDAEHALTRFARTARDEVDMDILSAALVGLASETMQPSRVSLWLLEKTDGSS